MGKELPFFQFEPPQYLTGNIQFCSLESQGLFINICAIYWQRECHLTLNQIKKKFDRLDLISELIDNDVIKTNIDNIIIEFLDEQFESITNSKTRLSDAGKKGALIKKQATLKPPLSEAKATLKQLDKIREDKIIENNIIESYFKDFENGNEIVRMAQFQKTNVDVLKAYIPQFRLKANSEYPSYGKFVDHFRNTFLKNPPSNNEPKFVC